MIETNEPTNGEVVKQETPKRITVTMIQNDLDNGIDRTGIQEKYGIEKWEVTQMFQHPELKGRKAKKVRKLSFNFVDDTETVDPNQTSIPVETGSATIEEVLEHEDVKTLDEVSFDEDDNGEEIEY
tara:strand:+ start:434 stop:811 length:378 start_codon:yes stop_codon:yes gene_type:complete